MAKDYLVKVGVRNGRILSRMRELGIPSVKELSRRSGVGYQNTVNLVQMRISPRSADGEWRLWVQKLALVLQADPEDLFNEQQEHSPLKKPSGEAYMDAQQIAAISSGGIESTEARLMVDKLLGSPVLNHRESRVLSQRYLDDMSLGEIGVEHGLSVERVRQIEAKALRKARNAMTSFSAIDQTLTAADVRQLKPVLDLKPQVRPRPVYPPPPPQMTEVERRMAEIDARVEERVRQARLDRQSSL